MSDPIPTLTPERRRLLDLCHRLGFGRIERLAVDQGEPRFMPPPAIVTEVKLGAERGTSERADGVDASSLHPAERDLLRALALVDTGTVRCLDVRHGLPFRLELDGELAA